jgi:hypothetical protein
MFLLHELYIRAVNIEFAGLSVPVKEFTWETHHAFIEKTNLLMVFSETTAIYYENHTEDK